jgi:formylmethanofuran dehydrogenase subunit E
MTEQERRVIDAITAVVTTDPEELERIRLLLYSDPETPAKIERIRSEGLKVRSPAEREEDEKTYAKTLTAREKVYRYERLEKRIVEAIIGLLAVIGFVALITYLTR